MCTETALLKVHNDIPMNMDSQRLTLLVLLDRSAAFDTVDIDVSLSRLEYELWLQGLCFTLDCVLSLLQISTRFFRLETVSRFKGLSSTFLLKLPLCPRLRERVCLHDFMTILRDSISMFRINSFTKLSTIY